MIESSLSPSCRTGQRRWARCRRGRVLLADLQRANVGDDGPTILHRNLRRVRRHRSPTVRDRVKEVSDRSLSQAIVIERRGPAETAAHDHAVAVSGHTVACGAEDVVTLAAALYDLRCNRQRESIDVVRESVGLRIGRRIRLRSCNLLLWCGGCACCSGFLAGEVLSIRTQLATRNRAFNRLPAPQSIAEKRRAAQRFDLRLVLHVTTTTSSK